MQFIRNISSIKKNLFSLLIALFPLSFVAGNLLINLNIILIILFSLAVYRMEMFKLKIFFFDKVLFSYFFLIIITAIYNDYYLYKQHDFLLFLETTFRSVLFLKYLLLYLSIRVLFSNNSIDLKFFFITSGFSVLFVCLDIVYQFYNGKDIFGFKTIGQGRRLGGPFGDELIAGGYLQRFSLFLFFLLPLFFKNFSDKYSKYLIPVLFIIVLIGIILSGNRMPFILFIFSIGLILIFQRQTRKFLHYFVLLFLIIFFSIFNLNHQFKRGVENFYGQISKMTVLIVEKDFDNKDAPVYLKEFTSFYDTWLLNKFIGGGIKNFRYYCHVKPNPQNKNYHCNMHPHNYYLEILTETGLVGLLIVMVLLINLLFLTFYKKYFTKSLLSENKLIIPFIFLLITEIFPLKSTGSFFTTGNTTYLFLIIGILIGLIREENSIENKYQ